MEKINAIIFDLDNTLIDRQRAFKEMLERKLPLFVPEHKQHQIPKMIEDILRWDANGTVSRYTCFQQFLKEYDIDTISAEELDQSWANESGSTAYLFDDVIATLSELKKKYRLALLSNGNPKSQRRKLATIDIDDFFEYTLISGEFSVNKPDSLIFNHVAKQLSLDSCQCVYVGDNYQVDIVGAKNAGMQAIYINRFNQPHPDTLSINSISELLDYLN